MDADPAPTAYEFGEFRADVVKRLLLSRVEGRSLPLSARAFDTLVFFLEHPGELLDKATLMAAIWPKVVVEENNLNQQISALRRVLGERPEEHRFIVTVPSRGYRFVASVHPVLNLESTASDAEHKPRLAVMPFENLSLDPNDAFFTDGLHEEIVRTIAERVPGIEVISRTTMMSYRATPPKPLGVVGRELGASHVIEGSVKRDRNRVRLTLQLIDPRMDEHIWSASYDRTLKDTLSLQSEIATEIAGRLPAEIVRPEVPDAVPIRDTQAFDLYLKALLALRTFRSEPEVFRKIEDLLTRAIARQPDFASAYAQRARARTLMFINSVDTREAFVNGIRADLATAQRLTPKDPIVLGATAYFLMCSNDTTGALTVYAAAEAAGLAEAEWLIPKAHLLLRRSRIAELNRTVQRMLALGPADPLVIYFAAYNYYRARQPLDALRAMVYAREDFPRLHRLRNTIALEFAGRTTELRSYINSHESAAQSGALAGFLVDYFSLLRFEHRYEELRAFIDRIPVSASTYFAGVDFGPVGQTPTARFRGWTDLLIGDRENAAKDGRAVLQFVQNAPKTPWNAAHLKVLAAEGHAFVGDCDGARVAARSGLGLASRANDAVVWSQMALSVARIEAWCGAKDEATSLLMELANGRPGVGPGAIARDPLFTVPLGRESAFCALSDELERRMHDTSLEPGLSAVADPQLA